MAISVIGLDFRTAPVNVREQVALTREAALQLLHAVAAEKILPEAMVLSTCNRTEFYFTAEEGRADPLPHLLGHIARLNGAPPLADASVFYRYEGMPAVRHLFRVAASLESQVVGEHEIMGQVKDAYRLACEARTVKFLFHKLLHWTFRAGKRVLSETNLGEGTASVSQAAVDLAAQIFSHLPGKTVMLVGAGQTAELAAQALIRAGLTHLIVANRTPYKAEHLAGNFLEWREQELRRGGEQEQITCPALMRLLEECPPQETPAKARQAELHARAVGLEDIPSVIAGVDLVISSTGATEPVLTHEALGGVLSRIGHPLLMIDIAVPRDVEERLGELPNVFLYNIDDLEGIVSQNLQRRRQEIPRAQAIIDDEVEAFGKWLSSLEVVATIKLLERRMAGFQQAEVERYHRKFTATDREQLQEFARTLCGKIMHDPISFLRKAGNGKDGPDLAAIDTLRRIFRLDELEER